LDCNRRGEHQEVSSRPSILSGRQLCKAIVVKRKKSADDASISLSVSGEFVRLNRMALEKYQIATIAYLPAVRRNNPWLPATGV
jgi:hypothetical protein